MACAFPVTRRKTLHAGLALLACRQALTVVGAVRARSRTQPCRNCEPSVWVVQFHEAVAVQLRTYLLPYVGRLWEEGAAIHATSAISPEVFLKLWTLSEPRIVADFILFDEAQESDGVMLSVLGRQLHAQIIYVGDPYWKIYEWRGAVNAMAQIDAPECAPTESFRFGATCAAACRCQNRDEIFCVPFVGTFCTAAPGHHRSVQPSAL